MAPAVVETKQPEWYCVYKTVKQIGEGTDGNVFKVVHRITRQAFALKQIKLDDEGEDTPSTALREVALLKHCKHPNVVQLHDVYSSRSELCLLFELLDMDLATYLKRMGPIAEGPNLLGLRNATSQCLLGIDFCHSRSVLHRDLKPENVLVDFGNQALKLADFGLARSHSLPAQPYTNNIVTLWYRSPEILLGQTRYGTWVDMWSIGCIVAEMATAQPLFRGHTQIDMLFEIFRLLGTPDDDVWPGVSQLPGFSKTFPQWDVTDSWQLCQSLPRALAQDGQELLRDLLRLNPRARASARQALRHAFVDPVAIISVAQGKPLQKSKLQTEEAEDSDSDTFSL